MIGEKISAKIILLVKSSLFDAQRAVDLVSQIDSDADESWILRKETGAASYALKGLSSISVAESLYWQDNDADEESVLGKVFFQYRVFAEEVIQNLSKIIVTSGQV